MLAASSYSRQLLLAESRRPPSTTPPSAGTRARGPLPHSTASRRLFVRSLHLLRRKLGPLQRAPSAVPGESKQSAGAPARRPRHPSGVRCSKGSALHAAVLQP